MLITRIKHFVKPSLVAAVCLGAFIVYTAVLGIKDSKREKRDRVAANLARLNEKYASQGKLELYSEYVASGRLAGRSEAEIVKLLGEPQGGFSGCDFSNKLEWFIGAREGDRTIDPYAADFFVKRLIIEWKDGRQTVDIREEHYPNTGSASP